MDHLQRLVVACLFASGTAHAAYAQLAPPAGWSSGASGGQFTFGPASNSATLANGTVRTNAALNVAGRSVSVPVSMRFAANAPRIAAAAIYMHPGLRTAAGIAAWLIAAKLTYDAADGLWKQRVESGSQDGYEYRENSGLPWSPTATSACIAAIPAMMTRPENWSLKTVVYSGNMAWGCTLSSKIQFESDYTFPLQRRVTTSPGGSETIPVTQQQMVEMLNSNNHIGWPTSVPKEIPGIPLPLELPVINPSTGVNPFPKPMFIPSGDPVPNPNYDPKAAPGPNNQPFIQPGTNVTPRPTPSNPWQVDLKPVDRPQANPEPLPDAEQNPEAEPNDKPKEEDLKSLCEKHPEILACQKVELDDIEPEKLQKNTVDLKINREEGFGPADAACPAPKQFDVMGKSMAFRWDLLCDFATQIRPLLVGFAYLSAALAFFGLSRKD